LTVNVTSTNTNTLLDAGKVRYYFTCWVSADAVIYDFISIQLGDFSISKIASKIAYSCLLFCRHLAHCWEQSYDLQLAKTSLWPYVWQF